MAKKISHHDDTPARRPSRSAYVQGCRCEECTTEQRMYARRYRGGLREASTPSPEVAAIDALIQQAIDAGDRFTVRALNEAKDDLISGV